MKVILPSYTKKRIYWNEYHGYAVILIGYCPDTLAYFQAMFDEAKKTFPNIGSEFVTCGKVTHSDSVKGFTLLSFPIEGEKRDIDGWETRNRGIDFSF